MSHFTRVAGDIDVAPLLAELDENPELWNHRPERRTGNSPHRETQDIWVRYARPEEMQEAGFMDRPHQSVWWPAFKELTALPAILMDVMDGLGIDNIGGFGSSVELGGILITRIPPGCQVYAHHDRGTWHAEHYTTKVWVVLRGNAQCVNTVEDEEIVWRPGEAWSHDNLLVHSVHNGGDTERIVLILCFRR